MMRVGYGAVEISQYGTLGAMALKSRRDSAVVCTGVHFLEGQLGAETGADSPQGVTENVLRHETGMQNVGQLKRRGTGRLRMLGQH
jgi:hypothetical protein